MRDCKRMREDKQEDRNTINRNRRRLTLLGEEELRNLSLVFSVHLFVCTAMLPISKKDNGRELMISTSYCLGILPYGE
ncbi:hypothetical protein CEXT_549491 [Caerostris extrusa]|uniref:Transmembrane protein n=1 Tax=Caerostris extrusa TaxID=172846 RepID=A0AAV4XT26_CAEEX|nr:hypothetical protein CEXT_549491 [Caerostris extrusa]